MNNITMIAAIGKNNELGKDNKLIWKLKEDMQFFKKETMNKPIIMGMNTYNSLPKLLPGRKHIVLTRRNPKLPDEVIIKNTIKETLDWIEKYKDEVMIIGGASIYKQFLEYSKKLLLTEINAEEKDADAYFPAFNKDEWFKEEISKIEENNISYKHLVYTRKEFK